MEKKQYVSPEARCWRVNCHGHLMDNAVSNQAYRIESGAWTKEENEETVGIWDLY